MVKYSLARLGLFVVAAAVLVALPVPVHVLVKLAAAVLVSAALSWFLLRGLRDQVSVQVGAAVQRRSEEKQRLRAALAGEETASSGDAASGADAAEAG